MRNFSVQLTVPTACDCCGAALPAHDGKFSRGSYRLELPEGDAVTTCTIGDGVRITLARGRLLVELRQRRGNNRAWALLPRYNSEAFRVLKTEVQSEKDDSGDWLWYSFRLDLPEFKPWYATWWAELKFTEVVPFSRGFNGENVPAHNAAVLSVKLETLE